MWLYFRTILIATSLLVALGLLALPVQADRDREHSRDYRHERAPGQRHHARPDYRRSHDYGYGRRNYGHRHHGHRGYGWGMGYAWAPGYAPLYPYNYGWGMGYGYGGYRSGYSLSLSLPLYAEPRYVSPPVRELVHNVRPASPPYVCQQTREYQTEVMIDGDPVPAYGTACLQSDGSWLMVSGPILAE